MAGRDPFEDRLRDALRGSDPAARPDVDAFLDDVHRGARSRRRRHTVVIAAAAALAVIGGGVAIGSLEPFDGSETPIADDASTSPASTGSSTVTPPASTPTAITNNGTFTTANTGVLSLTSTGSDHQWALASTPGDDCGLVACATVFESTADGSPWTPLGQLPLAAAGADRHSVRTVDQLRFVGDPVNGYDGYAFGGGLLTTHDDPATGQQAGRDWAAPAIPAPGDVTSLETHGATVYAIVADNGGSSALITSTTASDAFETVTVPGGLGTASNLVVTQGQVAFLNDTGHGVEVVSSPASADTGEATGDWQRSTPCDGGRDPIQISGASDSLWVLCSDGHTDAIAVRFSGSTQWSHPDLTTGPGSVLAARSTTDAVMYLADNTALMLVDRTGSRPLMTPPTGSPFIAPTMLGFTNDQVGFAIAQGDVYRTTNGGLSWSVDAIVPSAG